MFWIITSSQILRHKSIFSRSCRPWGFKHSLFKTLPTSETAPDPQTSDSSCSSARRRLLLSRSRNSLQDCWFRHLTHPARRKRLKHPPPKKKTHLPPLPRTCARTLFSSSSLFILCRSSSSRIWFPSRSNLEKASEISPSAWPILQKPKKTSRAARAASVILRGVRFASYSFRVCLKSLNSMSPDPDLNTFWTSDIFSFFSFSFAMVFT